MSKLIPHGIQARHVGCPKRLMGRTRTATVSRYSYRQAATTFARIEMELLGGQDAEIIGSAFTARGIPSDGPG
jgi:hypothetical protein